MKNSIVWRSNSSIHDWNDGHFVQRFLDKATDMKLIGPITWCQHGIRGAQKKIKLKKASDLMDKLTQPLPDEPPHRYLEAGGDAPFPWSLILSIAPFDEEENEPEDVNSVWLFFDKQTVSEPARSQELYEAFCAMNKPENTEYAFVHDYDHWLRFSDQNYTIPVTTGPTFQGIAWNTFLGPGQINEFDAKKLEDINAFDSKWVDDKGLYIRAGENVTEVDKPTNEAELKRLTEVFRKAIKSTSKWHKNLS